MRAPSVSSPWQQELLPLRMRTSSTCPAGREVGGGVGQQAFNSSALDICDRQRQRKTSLILEFEPAFSSDHSVLRQISSNRILESPRAGRCWQRRGGGEWEGTRRGRSEQWRLERMVAQSGLLLSLIHPSLPFAPSLLLPFTPAERGEEKWQEVMASSWQG